MAAAKKRNGGKAEKARAHTIAAEARAMKMCDGGFLPAFNGQFTTTCKDQVIVGVAVLNAGSDMAQPAPLVEQVEQRCGQSPGQWLVDSGYPAHEQIDAEAERTDICAPVTERRPRKYAKKDEQVDEVKPDKHAPRPDDSDEVAMWHQRMAKPEAKELYKQRAAPAE